MADSSAFSKYLREEAPEAVILFADLFESVRYREIRGFDRGLMKCYMHNSIATRIIGQNQGKVVKWLGDGVLSVFPVTAHNSKSIPSPANCALESACELVETLDNMNEPDSLPVEKFHTRIAISFGRIVYFTEIDPAGVPVHEGSHLMNLVQPDQILLTREFFDRLQVDELKTPFGQSDKSSTRARFSPGEMLHLKGLPRPIEVIEFRLRDSFLGISLPDRTWAHGWTV